VPFLEPCNKLIVERPPLVIHFAEAPLKHFDSHRQTAFWKTESGGQLFAEIEGLRWNIVRATGPRRSDYRRRARFFPSRKHEQSEINESFGAGLHYVGDWHTHPEPHPTPSPLDLESMQDLTLRSAYELPGFLMVIVGTDTTSRGLWISLHAGTTQYQRLIS